MHENESQHKPSEAVRVERQGAVLVVILDNPPVNALGFDVRSGLAAALDTAEADPDVHAVLLIGAGRHFIGGADIREFGRPRQRPYVHELCSRLENMAKPVVAAVSGATMGGGLEVAVGAHYRIASESAQLSLPEVRLGLLPGSGGTQRVTRLVGVPAALEMMLTGRTVRADEAQELGLVDTVVPDERLRDEALSFTEELIASGRGPRRSRDAVAALGDRAAATAAIADARERTRRKSPQLLSPHLIVDAIEAALTVPFDDALDLERSFFAKCEDSDQRAGLVHAFFTERAAGKVPEVATGTPRKMASAGVIGGGTMGSSIAVALLDAGLEVVMIERDDDALDRGRAAVDRILTQRVSKGRMDNRGYEELRSRFTGSTDYTALSDVDIVIEAVFEDMAVKHEVFAKLDAICKPGAILASNTSYLDIGAIAARTSRPSDVIGLHFFAPAHIMSLLEVVVAPETGDDTVATAFALAKRMGKVAVRAGVCDGFIGNRILSVYRRAAEYMIEDGATPYQIDSALRDFGYPMGPFQVADLSGGDIGWATRKRRAPTRDPRERYVHIADRIAERGWYGQKTGRGWYLYTEDARRGAPDPEVLAIIDQERAAACVTPRSFTDDEVVRRYLAAMINEGAKAVDEGIALRPLDVDVTFVHGFAFPRFRGGPMKYADTVGLDRIVADIVTFAEEDPYFWRVAPLLQKLADEGRTFESLNK